MSGLVSVIMPSFNSAKYIMQSVNSVLTQTYSELELIIVDDCSTDDTQEVLSMICDERVKRLKTDKNSGAAIARNLALKEAKGKWIAFLDADDIWSEDKLEKMIRFMEDNNYSFAYHNYEKIDEDSNPLNVFVTGPKRISKRKMYKYDYPGCLTFMYDAEVMGTVQIEDIKKNNDYAILLKLCKKSDCYLLNENLAKYRVRKVSISHDKLKKKIKSHYDLFHICDGRCALVSFLFASRNMWYGVWKKIRFEKKVK